jgi:DNA-binding transcriptional LysR family regulator
MGMSLSSLQLDAFQAVARQRSFSAAAKLLSLTQSALSQRVLKLEDELGATLFLREPAGIRLTELGERLLRYCESKGRLEEEFLAADPEEIQGLLRVGSFSTLSQSVLLPILGGLMKEHPKVRLELLNAEMRDLPSLLSSGRVDFLFTNAALEKQGVESLLVGHEENVLVRPTGKSPDIYLDHDPEDPTTIDFFRLQEKKQMPLNRSYLDEIYTILEGVKLGLGQAVAPLHIAKGRKGIEVAPGFKPLRLPIFLSYYSQSYYTRLHKLALARLQQDVPLHLGR